MININIVIDLRAKFKETAIRRRRRKEEEDEKSAQYNQPSI